MKRVIGIVVAAWLACSASCKPGSHDHADGRSDEHGHGHGHGHGDEGADHAPALSFTHWTDASELFLEIPALVRGETSTGAAHLTKIDGFAPLAEGRVTLVVRGDAGEERFEIGAPSVPGIFRPAAKPASAGVRKLVVEVRAPGFSADHELGEITVYESIAAARAALPAEPDAPGRIAFLKEQQWSLAFGTTVAEERPMRTTLRATGRVVPRSDGEVVVSAPVAGRVIAEQGTSLRIGEKFAAGERIAGLAPRLDAADRASLDLAIESARIDLRFAERERQRLEALRDEGAVPARRVEEAVHAYDEAKAALEAAQRRLDQFRRAQQPGGRGEGVVELRAPIAGTVTEVLVAPGAFVEAGAPLVRVTDLDRLWLEVRVPEIDAVRAADPRGASVAIEGFAAPFELGAESLIARAARIDPVTRTASVIFALDDANSRPAVGTTARVELATTEGRKALAVPETAIVDDGAALVVFVQLEGESFERRIVRVGARDHGYAEILSGVRAGEHVVSRGAWSVKLAASGGAVPAHGHSH